MIPLMDDIPLDVYRRTEDGYWQGGKWINEAVEEIIPIKCSIQPLRDGKTKIDLPEGVRSRDVNLIYTRTKLQSASEIDGRGDEVEIDGLRYECFHVENWSRSTIRRLRAVHYRHIFIRKDILANVQQ